MGSTYGTLETQMLRWLGNRDDGDTKAMLMASFNWVLDVISLACEFQELMVKVQKELTEGTYAYHIIDDFGINNLRKIQTIKINDGTRYYAPLDYLTPVRWDKDIAPYVENAGNRRPTAFTQRGNYILFNYPASRGLVAEIWYYKEPTKVTSTSSVLDIPTRYDSAIMAMAVGITWLGLEEPELSNKWMALGANMLRSFNIDINYVVDQRPSSSTIVRSGTSPLPWADPFVRR